jgi:hypothetical protein
MGARLSLTQFSTLGIVRVPPGAVHYRHPHSVDAPLLKAKVLQDRVLELVVCVHAFVERTVGLDLVG